MAAGRKFLFEVSSVSCCERPVMSPGPVKDASDIKCVSLELLAKPN